MRVFRCFALAGMALASAIAHAQTTGMVPDIVSVDVTDLERLQRYVDWDTAGPFQNGKVGISTLHDELSWAKFLLESTSADGRQGVGGLAVSRNIESMLRAGPLAVPFLLQKLKSNELTGIRIPPPKPFINLFESDSVHFSPDNGLECAAIARLGQLVRSGRHSEYILTESDCAFAVLGGIVGRWFPAVVVRDTQAVAVAVSPVQRVRYAELVWGDGDIETLVSFWISDLIGTPARQLPRAESSSTVRPAELSSMARMCFYLPNTTASTVSRRIAEEVAKDQEQPSRNSQIASRRASIKELVDACLFYKRGGVSLKREVPREVQNALVKVVASSKDGIGVVDCLRLLDHDRTKDPEVITPVRKLLLADVFDEYDAVSALSCVARRRDPGSKQFLVEYARGSPRQAALACDDISSWSGSLKPDRNWAIAVLRELLEDNRTVPDHQYTARGHEPALDYPMKVSYYAGFGLSLFFQSFAFEADAPPDVLDERVRRLRVIVDVYLTTGNNPDGRDDEEEKDVLVGNDSGPPAL